MFRRRLTAFSAATRAVLSTNSSTESPFNPAASLNNCLSVHVIWVVSRLLRRGLVAVAMRVIVASIHVGFKLGFNFFCDDVVSL